MSKNSTGGVQQQLRKSPGNAVQKYQQTVIGSHSWFALFLYEFIECFVSPVPGRLGRFLRSACYPSVFASCAGSVKIGANLLVHKPGKIFLAKGVVIEDLVTLNVKDHGVGIILQENVQVGRKAILSCPGGTITIGAGTIIEENCRLGSLQGLTIGKNCHIGKHSYLIGAEHAYDRLDIPIIKQPLTCRGETVIGDFVKIGAGVTIRDGIRIGDRAQVADGSLIVKDVAESSWVGGVPAVPVSMDVS